MEIILALVMVLGATAIILNLVRWASQRPFAVSGLAYINIQLKYQVLLLAVALLFLMVLYLTHEANFLRFWALGDIAAKAQEVRWLGIAVGESWLGLGVSLSFFITLATFSFMYLQFRQLGNGLRYLWPHMPWVLLFSLSNSFSEEVVYRLGVVVPLAGVIEPTYILLLSAIVFGAPHLRGMPNGLVGALMAGLLGWLLAKSVLETNGIFWAWFIHFLQDVVIFSALVLSAAKQRLGPNPKAIGRSKTS